LEATSCYRSKDFYLNQRWLVVSKRLDEVLGEVVPEDGVLLGGVHLEAGADSVVVASVVEGVVPQEDLVLLAVVGGVVRLGVVLLEDVGVADTKI